MSAFFYALRPVLFDSLGVIVFAVLFAMKVDVVVATAAGTAVAVGVVLWARFRGEPIAALQWISLISVLVSAAATLLTNDPRFVMGKPSVLYVLVGVVMLRGGWMHRYVPPVARERMGDLLTRYGYLWAGLMLLTGLLNLVVAVAFTASWPLFIGVFPLASKLALFGIQFTQMKLAARRMGIVQPQVGGEGAA
ncbi:intracellular septation protein [Cupriavidus metallidurans]|jgi:intracellular septation protein A|uniref:Intracellular septation protein n=1 Tax=Cupriavidus metallidurans (strain ATCC 43123 / DSM 2839 / NBRC 102507 / CH34) TaxID=266264 RepID=Q1LE72_CUPMC|nr:septation protein IspZ [Cupriavidus metallidurans]ABF11554.1 conserved hypothetical protein; putative intracellular septation protein [Cupriavidus metallidurans CH34]KWW32753.1 intracellular septation protein A [Cupriavidus metallidurans]MDE4920065.1 septation protein IspZ [Cupriavidus metallidurans]QGS31390.1 intracellular septation protein [Cupriavidus metallidurans]